MLRNRTTIISILVFAATAFAGCANVADKSPARIRAAQPPPIVESGGPCNYVDYKGAYEVVSKALAPSPFDAYTDVYFIFHPDHGVKPKILPGVLVHRFFDDPTSIGEVFDGYQLQATMGNCPALSNDATIGGQSTSLLPAFFTQFGGGKVFEQISSSVQKWHDKHHPKCKFVKINRAELIASEVNATVEHWTVEACNRQEFVYRVRVKKVEQNGNLNPIVSDIGSKDLY
jgi:hypothetical protein